ncbi:CDP-diacylglycerol--serine O-phosphatidyltransferase, partial [Rhizobium phaseoli]
METPFPPFEPNGPDDSARGPRLREIPLRLVFPNLLTILAICAGLTGIRLAFENRYELAVSMVLVAAFLDGIDGRVARLMKATSKFGAQMDSLADIVNFGVAPALVVYVFALDQARSLGWIAALIYAIAAGLRLARFNVMAERENKASWQSEYFVGVPAPAGAMLVLLPVYLGFLGMATDRTFAFVSSIYTVFIAFLLISRLPVWSGKSEG